MPDEKEKCKPLTKAQEARKTTKPIMEKRRRARINSSLTELKALLLDVMKKEGARANKMEKADILEMTVKHLRTVQRHQFEVAVASDPTTYSKYHSGFSECATEVSRYLTTVDGIDTDLKTRLLNHLANCVTSLDNSPVSARATPPATAHVRPIQMNPQRNAISPPLTVGNIKSVASVPVMTLPEINNNVIPAMHGLTVAGNNFTTSHSAPMLSNGGEDRLRNTDLAAFVIPGNVLSGAQLPGYIIPLYSGNASKLVQQDASDKDSSTLNLPTVVPVPIQLQQASPRAFTPDSSNIDSDKGMDLTLDSRQRKDARDAEVENRHHKEADEDVKPDIAEPASRNPNPAAEGPMWRPW